jgi:NAD(P)-dependent dehydrogenase (short-subunit alcohol dehydrogenase family)
MILEYQKGDTRMTHSAFSPGHVAVITGAASGIGLAACKRFASFGMKICLADIADRELNKAYDTVASVAPGGSQDVIAVLTDVSKPADLEILKVRVDDAFGHVDLLMNNAVTRENSSTLKDYDTWRQTMEVNLWGVINGVQTFAPAMIDQATPSLIVNSGSKQGITNPPGNSPYNVAKAALKSYTELLQHELRNTVDCNVTAHLLIPGMTTTGTREHSPGAWLPDQVIDMLVDSLNRGDFYILCPDGEVTREMDRKRILWTAGDITDNRPPLSRWHDNYRDKFEKFSP